MARPPNRRGGPAVIGMGDTGITRPAPHKTIHTLRHPVASEPHKEHTVASMSSVDRAIFMRLAHVRAAVLSLLAGGFLTLGVLAGWPGAARAGTVKASAASPSTSTSASASTTASTKSTASADTDTKCEVLPTATTPTPTPHPSTSSPTTSP